MSELVTFLAERKATGMTGDDAVAVHAALVATCDRLAAAGERVEYLRSFHLSESRRWFGLFAAANPHVVHRVARIAQLSSVEVHRVNEFVAPARESTSVTGGKRGR